MTQLTLGVDRDAGGPIAATFDERDDAVKAMLSLAIDACRERGAYCGICGQGPSDHPDLAQWLVAQGIESMSLNPDTVVSTWMLLAKGNPAANAPASATLAADQGRGAQGAAGSILRPMAAGTQR